MTTNFWLTWDCIRPFSVTTQCVEAQTSQILCNNIKNIFHNRNFTILIII